MTRTGDREIRSVSGRLPDNPGELARMQLVHHRLKIYSPQISRLLHVTILENP